MQIFGNKKDDNKDEEKKTATTTQTQRQPQRPQPQMIQPQVIQRPPQMPQMIQGQPQMVQGIQAQPQVIQGQPGIIQGQPPIMQGQPPIMQGQPPIMQGQPPIMQGQPPIIQGPMMQPNPPMQGPIQGQPIQGQPIQGQPMQQLIQAPQIPQQPQNQITTKGAVQSLDGMVQNLIAEMNMFMSLANESVRTGDKIKTLVAYSLAWHSGLLGLQIDGSNLVLQNLTKDAATSCVSIQDIVHYALDNAQGGRRGSNDDEVDHNKIKPVDLSKTACLYFRDVIGMTKVKQELRNSLIDPLLKGNLYPSLSKGILLYGLPGVGKTYIIEAAVNELQTETTKVIYYAPSGQNLKGKYVGETEKLIAAYFDGASQQALKCTHRTKGQMKVISILFIDEIESLGKSRDSEGGGGALGQDVLLTKMQGIEKIQNVVVIGATNYPWQMDSAVFRRFGTRIYIDLPQVDDIVKLMCYILARYLQMKKPKDFYSMAQKLMNEKGTEDISEAMNLITGDNTVDLYDPCVHHQCTPTATSQHLPNLFDIIRLPASTIKTYAKKLYTKNFSNSDVNRYMQEVIKAAAIAAETHGCFRYGKLINDNNPGYYSVGSETDSRLLEWLDPRIIRINDVDNQFVRYKAQLYVNTKLLSEVSPHLISKHAQIYVSRAVVPMLIQNKQEKKGMNWRSIFRSSTDNQEFTAIVLIPFNSRSSKYVHEGSMFVVTSVTLKTLENIKLTSRYDEDKSIFQRVGAYFMGDNALSVSPLYRMLLNATDFYIKVKDGLEKVSETFRKPIKLDLLKYLVYHEYNNSQVNFLIQDGSFNPQLRVSKKTVSSEEEEEEEEEKKDDEEDEDTLVADQQIHRVSDYLEGEVTNKNEIIQDADKNLWKGHEDEDLGVLSGDIHLLEPDDAKQQTQSLEFEYFISLDDYCLEKNLQRRDVLEYLKTTLFQKSFFDDALKTVTRSIKKADIKKMQEYNAEQKK